MRDDEHIDGLRRGDFKTQLAFLEEYQAKLVEYLLRRFRTLSSEDIEQIAADLIYNVIEDPSTIDLPRGTVKGYLYRAAHNQAIDLLKKQRTALGGKHLVSLDESDEESLEEVEEPAMWATDNYPGIDEEGVKICHYPAEVLDAAAQLGKELKITEEQIEHIRLRLVERFEPSEVATLLQIDPNAERVRWSRLMKKLKEKWDKYPALRQYANQFKKGDSQMD